MICMCVTLDLEFPIAPIRSLSAPVRSRERQRRVRDMRVPRFFWAAMVYYYHDLREAPSTCVTDIRHRNATYDSHMLTDENRDTRD